MSPMAFQKRLFAPEFSIAIAVFLVSLFCNSHAFSIAYNDPNYWKRASSVYDFWIRDCFAQRTSLKQYKGYFLIIVNIEMDLDNNAYMIMRLNKLHKMVSNLGVKIIAFPSQTLEYEKRNPYFAFSKTELLKHKIYFDVVETTIINGPYAHQLWKYLKHSFNLNGIDENYMKFFIDRSGKPVALIDPNALPKELLFYIHIFDNLKK